MKDAFHRYVVSGEHAAVNPEAKGTKVAAHFVAQVAAWEELDSSLPADGPQSRGRTFIRSRILRTIVQCCFRPAQKRGGRVLCAALQGDALTEDAQRVQRQAFAGLLWGKQSYHYDVRRWLEGDPTQPTPDPARRSGRNHEWFHLYNSDVVSMPDKWEYPWYAAWDLGFHCVAMALIDPDYAKDQLVLFLREWYMHPNGELPAYEWNFSDVNPPVHAWAAWRVYKIEGRIRGKPDRAFLERVFHKLLLNFPWWVNRKDPEGKNVFEGGFLGLDNIGVFDRSTPLGPGNFVEQSDGTSWMAMYCLDMLAMAMELAREDPAYEDIASKFFEHFVYISQAMNDMGGEGIGLWDEKDGFYYDVLHMAGSKHIPDEDTIDGGFDPAFRRQDIRTRRSGATCRAFKNGCNGFSIIIRTSRNTWT